VVGGFLLCDKTFTVEMCFSYLTLIQNTNNNCITILAMKTEFGLTSCLTTEELVEIKRNGKNF
jgi:hypothetical protein